MALLAEKEGLIVLLIVLLYASRQVRTMFQAKGNCTSGLGDAYSLV